MACTPCTSCTRREPIRVAVTGAAGQIGYSLCFKIAAGEAFGSDQPIILHMIELNSETTIRAGEGVKFELIDCAFPLLVDVIVTGEPEVGFKDVDYAVLVGAAPRKAGQARSELVAINGPVFEEQGRALDKVAKKTCKVFVVGNPANTNALICSHFAPSIPRENFAAMTALDHNRTVSQIVSKLGISASAVSGVTVFGNHADSMVPYTGFVKIRCARTGEEMTLPEACKKIKGMSDDQIKAFMEEMIATVRGRGGAITRMRGSSSAGSAAKACVDSLRAWHCGTKPGEHYSMAVLSECAGGAYGVKPGVCFSYPLIIKDGRWQIYEAEVCPEAMEGIRKTEADLFSERAAAGLK